MSSPLPAKRRKINGAAAALSKPFVSPLRTKKSAQSSLNESTNAGNTRSVTYTPSTLAHTVTSYEPPSSPRQSTGGTSYATPARPTPIRRQPGPTPRSTKRTDPVEIAAQRAITSLELQIRSVRNDIEALQQASKLRSSDTDSDLSDLTLKWRLASQSAAEDLFGTVKERVNRMGGVAAWREAEKTKYERSHGMGDFAAEPEVDNDADCEFDSQGEELPEDEQEYRKKKKRRMKQEMLDASDVEPQAQEEQSSGGLKGLQAWQQPGGDDDAFTMDMMLRSLNIDLDVIGYDKEGQRWETT